MHYTEYFTLRDCSGFLQIRSHIHIRRQSNVLFTTSHLKTAHLKTAHLKTASQYCFSDTFDSDFNLAV